MDPFQLQQFKKGALYAFILAVIIFLAVLYFGKIATFLWLNNNMGIVGDNFFYFCTVSGNGAMWVVLLLFTILILGRTDAWPLLAASCFFSTLFTQISKHLIAPGAPRPWSLITDHSLFHHVSFVDPLSSYSFPSGHTATAFCIYLILCLLVKQKWWVFTGFIVAALIGYSRVYLAQHFPVDVGGGIIIAILSVAVSLPFQKLWTKKLNKRMMN